MEEFEVVRHVACCDTLRLKEPSSGHGRGSVGGWPDWPAGKERPGEGPSASSTPTLSGSFKVMAVGPLQKALHDPSRLVIPFASRKTILLTTLHV
eukprot:67506-Chlamydomonas_euryale.AAC.11